MKNPFRRQPAVRRISDDALAAAIRRSLTTVKETREESPVWTCCGDVQKAFAPPVWTCGQLGLCGDPDEAA